MIDSRLPPGAYSRKETFGGTPNVSLPYVVPALVGLSLGSGVVVSCEAVTRGPVANTSDVLANAASGSGLLRSVSRIADTCDGVANYYEGNHFQLTNDMIDWSLSAQMSSPSQDTPVTDTGGTLSGTYYYVVTTRDQATNETNWVSGMAFVSGVVGATSTMDLSWECIPNASGYRVYRTTTLVGNYPDFSGSDGGLIATVAGACAYNDTGDAVASGTTPPIINATQDEPAPSGTYYVDYAYSSFEFNRPRRFTSLTEVQNTYGWGSQLSVMAEYAMSTIPGRGNEAPAVWCVAAGDSTAPTQAPTYSNYQDAISALEDVGGEQLVLVAGKNSATMRQAVKLHCESMSDLEHKKERIGLCFPPANTSVGSSGDSTSIIGMAVALASKRACLVAVDSGSAKGYVQNADATDRSEVSLEPEYVAAAVAGRVASLTDTSTPLTRKQIVGLTTWDGTSGRPYNRTELIQMSEAGVLVPQYKDDALWSIYKGITTETAIQDDSEMSVVLATDTLAMAWREAMDPTTGSLTASLVGGKLTPGLLKAVVTRTQFVLDDLVGKGIINSYDANSIEAEQDATTLTQVNVSFNYEPIFPVNTIILTFSTSFSITGS